MHMGQLNLRSYLSIIPNGRCSNAYGSKEFGLFDSFFSLNTSFSAQLQFVRIYVKIKYTSSTVSIVFSLVYSEVLQPGL